MLVTQLQSMLQTKLQPKNEYEPKPLQSTTTFYSPWVYAPNGVASSLNFVQGIGAGTRKNTYTIVGTYGQLNNGAVGVVYQGAINGTNTTQGSGPGTWTTMVVPTSFGSLGTSIYGVHKKGDGKLIWLAPTCRPAKPPMWQGPLLIIPLASTTQARLQALPRIKTSRAFRLATRLPDASLTKLIFIA